MQKLFIKYIINNNTINLDKLLVSVVFTSSIYVLYDAYNTGNYPMINETKCNTVVNNNINSSFTSDDITSLQDRSYLIIDNFINNKQLKHALNDIRLLKKNNNNINNNNNNNNGIFEESPNKSKEIRTDIVYFLKDDDRNKIFEKRFI
jgi:hypothetical protein